MVFFTDGNLDMDDSQKADLLSFVRDDGKGFIGIHSATITFTGWPAYGEMIGGYFDGHPWGVFEAPLIVEDATFPGMKFLPGAFTLKDEIYQIKDYSRDRVRVLLRLDADKIDLARKGVRRKDGDFAVIWARGLRQRPSPLQRAGPPKGSLGSARDPENVARAGPLVDRPGAGDRRTEIPVAKMMNRSRADRHGLVRMPSGRVLIRSAVFFRSEVRTGKIRWLAVGGGGPTCRSVLENPPSLTQFIRELVDSGEIDHPLAWSAREAYRFLQAIPLLEQTGLIVRVPDWWNAQKPARPSVNVKIDSKD